MFLNLLVRSLLLNLLVRSRIVSFWWPAVAKRLDSIGVKRCRCYIMYICGIHGKQVTLMFILMCWSILKLEANGSETWLKSLRDFDFFSDCVYKHWMLPRPWSQKSCHIKTKRSLVLASQRKRRMAGKCSKACPRQPAQPSVSITCTTRYQWKPQEKSVALYQRRFCTTWSKHWLVLLLVVLMWISCLLVISPKFIVMKLMQPSANVSLCSPSFWNTSIGFLKIYARSFSQCYPFSGSPPSVWSQWHEIDAA